MVETLPEGAMKLIDAETDYLRGLACVSFAPLSATEAATIRLDEMEGAGLIEVWNTNSGTMVRVKHERREP